MSNRVEIPIDTSELLLARKNANMVNPSVDVDSMGNIVPRRSDGNRDGYTVMIRKSTNSGDRPKNAKSLMSCKGLKGCDFAECAKKVFGTLPKNLKRLDATCSTNLNVVK